MGKWVNITETGNIGKYPDEGVDVLVSDGVNYDIAWYLMSGEYVWMKNNIHMDDSIKFTSFIPIKWMKIFK